MSWASGRPIDASVAGGIGAAAYVVLGLLGPYADSQPSSFVGNLALYFFFALATSGFFTVARRIGALEIATEISPEVVGAFPAVELVLSAVSTIVSSTAPKPGYRLSLALQPRTSSG